MSFVSLSRKTRSLLNLLANACGSGVLDDSSIKVITDVCSAFAIASNF